MQRLTKRRRRFRRRFHKTLIYRLLNAILVWIMRCMILTSVIAISIRLIQWVQLSLTKYLINH